MEMRNLMQPANEAEANAIKMILADNGIEAEIRSFHDTAYDGIYQAQYGWGVIRVSDQDMVEAKKIIEEWHAAAPDDLPWEGGDTAADE